MYIEHTAEEWMNPPEDKMEGIFKKEDFFF